MSPGQASDCSSYVTKYGGVSGLGTSFSDGVRFLSLMFFGSLPPIAPWVGLFYYRLLYHSLALEMSCVLGPSADLGFEEATCNICNEGF